MPISPKQLTPIFLIALTPITGISLPYRNLGSTATVTPVVPNTGGLYTQKTFTWRAVTEFASILLINTNISTDSYTILLVMHSNVTAVRFKGEHGFLSLFNIYNKITNNDTISCLDSFLDHHEQLVRPAGTDSVVCWETLIATIHCGKTTRTRGCSSQQSTSCLSSTYFTRMRCC